MFLGSLWRKERGFIRTVLERLDRDTYPELVEPCAGSLAISLLGVDVGYRPAAIDASDVSLYSALLGGVAAGRALEELDVRVDGEPFTLEGPPAHQAAAVLHRQVVLRCELKESKHPTDYIAAMLEDLRGRELEHVAALEAKVESITTRLRGIRYRSLDLFAHVAERGADPAIVILNPPTYRAGYERFFDTGGRLTWSEPSYGTFDPDDGVRQLLAESAGVRALLLVLQETEPGGAAGDPVYARHAGPGRYTYYLSNRPDEVKALLGGVRVVTRATTELVRPPGMRALDPARVLTRDADVIVKRLEPDAAAYWRELWTHRQSARTVAGAFGVFLDGELAVVAGLSRPTGSAAPGVLRTHRIAEQVLLMWAFSPVHERYRRLSRLGTVMALQRATLDLMATPRTELAWATMQRVVTVEESRMPETKGLRGLMTLEDRQPHPTRPGCWRLVYGADIEHRSHVEAFRWWLEREERWLATRSGDAPARKSRRRRPPAGGG